MKTWMKMKEFLHNKQTKHFIVNSRNTQIDWNTKFQISCTSNLIAKVKKSIWIWKLSAAKKFSYLNHSNRNSLGKWVFRFSSRNSICLMLSPMLNVISTLNLFKLLWEISLKTFEFNLKSTTSVQGWVTWCYVSHIVHGSTKPRRI
jgi:hypothetical protein